MKSRLVKNSVVSVFQALLNIVLIAIATPLFINLLGAESYGVFAVVMVVGNLNSFVNLGLSNSLLKFVAEQGVCFKSNVDIIVNVLILSITAAWVNFTVFLFDDFLIYNIFKIPNYLIEDAKLLLFWALLSNVVLLIGQSFKSILDALQLVYVTSLLQLGYNILYWGLMICILIFKPELSNVGLMVFISSFVWFFFIILLSLKKYGKLTLNGIDFSSIKISFKKQFNYSLKLFSSSLIGFFFEPLSKVLVSSFVGVSEVGYFDIALKVKAQINGLFSKLFYPLLPFISNMKEMTKISQSIKDVEMKTFILTVPAVAIFSIIAQPMMALWLGSMSTNIIWISTVCLVFFNLIFSSTVIPIYLFLLVKDHVEKTILIQVANAIVNIVVFFIFAGSIGYYAIIISNSASVVFAFCLSIFYQKKYLNNVVFDSFKQILLLVILFVVLIVIGYLIEMIIFNRYFFISTYAMVGLVFSLLYYNYFSLISIKDILKYLGVNNSCGNYDKVFYKFKK